MVFPRLRLCAGACLGARTELRRRRKSVTVGSSFPADGTHFNFTVILSSGRFVPITARTDLVLGLRYLHLSNANLLRDNSGYDGLQLVLGSLLRFD